MKVWIPDPIKATITQTAINKVIQTVCKYSKSSAFKLSYTPHL